MYPKLRVIHLLSGVFALPMLVMYGVSAVQMAHNKWFVMKLAVSEAEFALRAGQTDGRAVAREAMEVVRFSAEINTVKATEAGFDVRLLAPGAVREVRYERSSGRTRVRTSVAGTMGMLNRLHHAAGLWHEYGPLRLWGMLVGLVSVATLVMSLTGLWMWWLRREDRVWGLVLLVANLGFSLVVLVALRAAAVRI